MRGVAAHEVEAAGADPVAVEAGKRERIGFLFHGPDLGAGGLGGDCEGDGSRAGAQVDDAGLTPGSHNRRGLVDGEPGKDLRFGAHDEDAGDRLEGERPEIHPAGDVLEGDAQGTLAHAGAELLLLVLIEVGRQGPLRGGVARPLEELTHVSIRGGDPGLV